MDRDTIRPLAVSSVGPGSWVDWGQLGGHVGKMGGERNEGFELSEKRSTEGLGVHSRRRETGRRPT